MTTKKTVKKSGSSASSVVGGAILGASLAGLAATAYFFFGPKGKTNQKHAKAWAIKMKGDVIEKLETASEVSEAVYHDIIDSVAGEYEKGMKASHEEISELASGLKKHWKTLTGSKKAVKRKAVKGVKKMAKKAAR
ncbi:MAG: hypothetical protein Q7R99_03370 [bacterium]|nr:hypothetical protein [bacterium]